jgi:two-component system, NtrC family, sensor kinase
VGHHPGLCSGPVDTPDTKGDRVKERGTDQRRRASPGWLRTLRAQSLRTKMIITAVGTAVVVFAVISSLTFGYWRQESVSAAEQQALLAAASVRSAVETGLTAGDPGRARRALQELVQLESIVGARVYGPNGVILVSNAREEEGTRPAGVWIPGPRDLPPGGTARLTPDGDLVNAFLPVRAGGAVLLQVDFSLVPIQEAMDRAARLGLLLLVGSVAAVIFIVATMLEREVVTPMERMAGILRADDAPTGGAATDLAQIEASISALLRKERETARRAAEQEERLASQAGFAQVGEMAAEMAHEFKRPLASIRSAITLLEQEYELNDQAQSLLAAVDGQLGKLTETMQDLFALARPVELESERVELADTVDSALAQLAGLVDTSGRRVHRDYDPATPPVYGDRHRIEQAVLNIALNAMEAMETGGSLSIALRPAGDGAELEFKDTGPGIPESEIEKVVLPFYSTKPAGTGLGLPLVARVVAAHRGSLDIRSEPDVGTTVRITLPHRPWAEEREGGGTWRTHAS